MLTAEEIIRMLDLAPLEPEGGYFRETYRCAESVAAESLPDRYGGPRSVSTAIYYLLTPETHSKLHRVASDEVFHFLLGDPVTMLQLSDDDPPRTLTIGPDLAAGQSPQVVVPRGTWQGCRLADGGAVALMGVTVAPGFDYADFEPADADVLIARWPDAEAMIRQLA